MTADAAATDAVHRLTARSQTVATAESLTGGLLCAALVSVPGASVVVRGGVVAYAGDVKTGVLGVPSEVVDRYGTVAAETASAMAEAARTLLAAYWGVATTGVAGPDEVEGRPVGLAYVAVAGPDGVQAAEVRTPGTREEVRAGTVAAALRLLVGASDR